MLLVKVGGGASINLDGIARDLGRLDEPAVVVHGANACRDALAERLGQPTRTITSASGVSSVLTDDDALDALTMAYAGLVNKRFVQLCQSHGVNAIGLTGLDGALVRGRRNPGIRVHENGKKRLVRDHSGKPDTVNTALLMLLVEHGYTPLITVPILDEEGRPVSTENDSVVALLQKTLAARRVVQLLEAPGILDDADDPESVVVEMRFSELEERARSARGRFQRKLMALSKMAAHGCEEILLSDGTVESPLSAALSAPGTRIRA
jgi:acetylglutamate/LysW-gamma-L-alpha-aminoadipate kinase